jgi:hypothetical protein
MSGLDLFEADDLAGLYADAMKLDPKARALMLARRGVKMLDGVSKSDVSPTARAWKARGGRA